MNSSNQTEYDFIIIGAGSAGCVLANRLSELPVNVLVIEAGDRALQSAATNPVTWHTMMETELDWNYSTVPQPGLNKSNRQVQRWSVANDRATANVRLAAARQSVVDCSRTCLSRSFPG